MVERVSGRVLVRIDEDSEVGATQLMSVSRTLFLYHDCTTCGSTNFLPIGSFSSALLIRGVCIKSSKGKLYSSLSESRKETRVMFCVCLAATIRC